MTGLTQAQLDEVMGRYMDEINAEVARHSAAVGASSAYLAADNCRDIFRRSWMAVSKAIRDAEGSG